MTDNTDTPAQSQPTYTEKAYYKERLGEVIHVAFRDTSSYQGRLVGVDKHHIFVESVTANGELVMINKDAIQYVGPPVYGS